MGIIVIIILGLCFGSFVNALVWRLHSQPKVKCLKLKAKDLSVLHGRSMCVHCHHMLAWYDLLPIVSWLALKGKCRYCHKPISPQYPLVELITACLFVLSFAAWPHDFSVDGTVSFVVWLVLITGFMSLTVYDLRWMLLPNKIVFPLLILTVLHLLLQAVLQQDIQIIISALWGMFAVGGVFYLLFQISRGRWIGGGDVKLGIVLGLLAGGFIEGLLVIFVASLLGTVASLGFSSKGNKKLNRRVPFGPFLMMALIIVYLFGQEIITRYDQLFLLT